ncbi:brain-enriched guanylate kinase-associated protein isoform X1 [Myotis myotis]|uniref:brain-enriched guanylate kinase-associated protein isoform X1 n=2 Tax=Myotis myotis TaxID=51298 RepID=UPI00174C6715|nr:brain-enriched guanylate kinase-associated protein isoform X1 [Myotis myotis]XP_036172800.1 brain-enriched guanylate kinase-associated protein isoform X1 [Myotis myotis]
MDKLRSILSWPRSSRAGETPRTTALALATQRSSSQGPSRLRSPWVPSCLGQSCTLQGRRTRSSPSLWDSVLQEQKSELRKRLSYTTHRLQKLESEFGSTRSYLEVELRRAQEELEKVTLKLRRSGIQSNYMSLQRINRELEQKLYRMGKHYDEEKRALSHEIVALNNHLLEAKMTIDKLAEDNELYRKDCNLAAQLLQCSQTYGRVHKVSELPAEFQERLSLHLEKHGCSMPSTHCRPGSVPLCVIAKVLEKPEPSSLSSPLSMSVSVSDASTRDLGFREGMPKSSLLPPYKEDAYCSDSALFCPESRDRDRRPSVDAVASDMSFLQTQNSTDSACGEEEAGAAAYPEAYPEEFRREAFPGYTASLPTSSSYSSFSATSEEREHGEASTMTASQRAVYLDSREQLFQRQPAPTYQSSRPYAKASGALLEAPVPPEFELETTFPSHQAEPFSLQAVPKTLVSPNLWSLRAKSPSSRMPRGEARSPREQWRPVHVEEMGAHAFPVPSRRLSPRSFSQRHYASVAHGRASPLYASYKADNFSEDDDFSQGHLAESCFLGACGSAKPMPSYAASEDDGDRPQGQLCGVASPEPDSLFSSRDSFEPSSMEGSPEMHPAARRNPQAAFSRSRSSGLSRKDSLTKAQLYGTLLN